MGYIDIHSHILPGMDDGARSMEQSLAMLKIACDEGIETIIATPHNMPRKGCPSKETVERKVEKLKEAVQEAGLSIEILMGTEYFYREEVLEIFEEERGITMAGTDKVLIEFDPGTDAKYIRNAAREILSFGYKPVIAHVERYAKLLDKRFEAIADLRKMGALIQVNAGSVMGNYGWKTKRITRALLKKELVDLLGSDAHSDGRRAPRMKDCAEYVGKKMKKPYSEYLLSAKALFQ